MKEDTDVVRLPHEVEGQESPDVPATQELVEPEAEEEEEVTQKQIDARSSSSRRKSYVFSQPDVQSPSSFLAITSSLQPAEKSLSPLQAEIQTEVQSEVQSDRVLLQAVRAQASPTPWPPVCWEPPWQATVLPTFHSSAAWCLVPSTG